MVTITNAFGLKDGDEQLLPNTYRKIEIWGDVPYAFLTSEEEKRGVIATVKEVFLISERKKLAKKYKDLMLFWKRQNSTEYRYDLVLAQDFNEKWGILNPYTGEEVEPLIHRKKPKSTDVGNIFIFTNNYNKRYFKDIISGQTSMENWSSVISCDTKNLYFVRKWGNIGIFDLVKNKYMVPLRPDILPSLDIHHNDPFILVKTPKESILLKQYTGEEIMREKKMFFDYSERTPAVISIADNGIETRTTL